MMRTRSAILGALGLLCGCGPGAPTPPLPTTGIRVLQQEGSLLPGSDGRLRVELGDVADDQALVRIAESSTGEDLLPQRSMRVGDTARFEFDGHGYGLVMTRLEAPAPGDAVAEFRLTSPDAEGAARIEALLQRIETSGLTFVRNGEDHAGQDAAAHLRRKWRMAGSAVGDPETFIEQLATRSSLSGDEYLVRLGGDRSMGLADWLRGDPADGR